MSDKVCASARVCSAARYAWAAGQVSNCPDMDCLRAGCPRSRRVCETLGIDNSGPDNHLRLTGLHETQAIDKFSYGLSDGGASIRMPINFVKNGYRGYLEDRRPNSEGDPYQIVSRILKTINTVPQPEPFARVARQSAA